MSQYLKSHKWTYLRENIERSNSSRQRAGHFRISTGISKPKHVFVFIINDANIDAQTANPFLYNTFSVSTDPRTLSKCHLEVGNGNEYTEIYYTPTTDMTRVYRGVLKYVHKNNEYTEGTLLNRSNCYLFYTCYSRRVVMILKGTLLSRSNCYLFYTCYSRRGVIILGNLGQDRRKGNGGEGACRRLG